VSRAGTRRSIAPSSFESPIVSPITTRPVSISRRLGLILPSNMPNSAKYKGSHRHKGSRTSASSQSGRTGSSRSSTASRHSTARSSSVASVRPPRHRQQSQRAPFVQASSRIIPADAQQSGDLAPETEDVNDDTLSEVIMALDMTPRGTVGCCYYIAREERLYFMEDIQIGDVDIVDTCGSPYRERRARY
jgi:DNA mismatch repair protein MSH5